MEIVNKIKCEICGRECNGFIGLSSHIIQGHKINCKEYYDKYLKRENEGICLKCGKETIFNGLVKSYYNYCLFSCESKIKCKICGKEIKNFECLSRHTRKHIIKAKEYYDRYLKRENEGICLKCGKETKFISIKDGYNKYCLIKCLSKFKIKCELCKREFNKIQDLSNHIRTHNIKPKEYYIKYLKKENEGVCLELNCKKETSFINLNKGYCKFCSLKCLANNKENKEKKKIFYLKKYGVDHWAKSDEGKEFHSEQILKQRANQVNHGEPVFPSIGEKERSFFDKCELKLGIKFIRQDRVAGKWSDGRPEPFWIHLRTEYNERNHYNFLGILNIHDVKRELRIAAKGFIIYNIKESDCDINEDLEIEKLGKFIEMLKEEYQPQELELANEDIIK